MLQIVDVTRLSFRVELTARCCCAVFCSQLAPRVTRTRSVQAVVYLERHVVSFEYFRVIVQYNNRLYIMPPRFQRFVRTEGILDRVWCTLVIIPVILRRHEFLQSGICGWGPIYGLFQKKEKKNGGVI